MLSRRSLIRSLFAAPLIALLQERAEEWEPRIFQYQVNGPVRFTLPTIPGMRFNVVEIGWDDSPGNIPITSIDAINRAFKKLAGKRLGT